MLDPYLRPIINPPLEYFGSMLIRLNFKANTMTLLGFLFGALAFFFIATQEYGHAAILIILNRAADGLDGAIARHSKLTDFGGFLDIVCDFIVYSGIVFAFAINNHSNAFPAAFLIFSFIGPITTFLAYAVIAAKHQIQCTRRGMKSFYYLGGICEGTETTLALFLMCIFPHLFSEICWAYGILCWMTTIGRIYMAWDAFRAKDTS